MPIRAIFFSLPLHIEGSEQEATAETDLAELARSTAAPYASQGEQLKLAEFSPARVRPPLLKWALANMLDNAVKYGGGEIAINL